MTSLGDLVEGARRALEEGDYGRFKLLARSRDAVKGPDAAFHKAWADLLEQAGMVGEQVKELRLALGRQPADREVASRLAEIYLDENRPDQAALCWEAYLKHRPDDASAYRRLGEIHREAGKADEALRVFREGGRRTRSDLLEALVKEMRTPAARQEDEEAMESAEEGEHIVPARHHLVTFTTLFAGRQGVYARQWVSPTGQNGYTPVHEPLTLKVAENHILGRHTIGVYPLRMDNTVSFVALDLDVAKSAMDKAIARKSLWDRVMGKLHGVARKAVDLGAAHELPVYLEDSGFKGRHAWIFTEGPVPAGVARRCGELLGTLLGPLPEEVAVEVFPKQTRVKAGGLGNLIKLPLGYHKRTNRRALFLRPDGAPAEDQLELLGSVKKASLRAIHAFIQRVGGPKTSPVPAGPGFEEAVKAPWQGTGEGDAREKGGARVVPASPSLDLVPAEDYDVERDRAVQYILSRCEVLHGLVRRINEAGRLSRDEALVLVHTLGHLDTGPRAVNALLQRCDPLDPSLLLKSPLRGNPMSCAKVRIRVPDVASRVDCRCVFDSAVNLYPTPLLHAYSMKEGGGRGEHPLGLSLDSMQFQALLKEYLRAKGELRELALLVRRMEDQLHGVFDEAGVSSVRTPLGEVKRVKDDQGGRGGFMLRL